MNHKELLLSKRWILKSEDREKYYMMKDHIQELRRVFQDKIGYSLISHPQFIRLDKIPGKSEPWMGIQAFQYIEEYQMFCLILVFLEDKDIEEQFILSHLTEFLQLQLHVNEEYWLKYLHRRMFVNVLKFCMKEKLIIQDDGESENFLQDQSVEALFENTGLSRFFMRNFVTDVFEWRSVRDVENSEWMNDQSKDRGMIRTQRVYRRLLLSCGIYREDDEMNDDFSYIRRFRKNIENDFQQFFPCDLQVYESSAYLILDEEVRVGQRFPKNHALDELCVICCTKLRQMIKKNLATDDYREIYREDKEVLLNKLGRIIKKNIQYLPSTYRKKSIEQLVQDVYTRLIQIGFIKEEYNEIECYPVIGKLMGSFEEDYHGK